MDVKSAFLHGDLFEEIYMEKTLGFMADFDLVFRLKKTLYGLKQAPCAWYENIDCFYMNNGFKLYKFYHNVVYLVITQNNVILNFSLKNNLQTPSK